MPQNEHRKVLMELSEAYDAVYNEGLPAAKPAGNTSVGDEATNWHRQGSGKPGSQTGSIPGYALHAGYEEYPEESLYDKYEKAYGTWLSDMREYTGMGSFNPKGPVHEQDLVKDGRLIGKKGQPVMPTAEEFGIEEHEADRIQRQLGINPGGGGSGDRRQGPVERGSGGVS